PSLGSPNSPVVVTGGASGIGRASTLAVAEVGRPVAVWDVDEAGAAKTAAECVERFDVATFATQVDVRDRGAIEAAAAATVATLGPVGGLVHAAGIVRVALDDVVDSDTWDDVLTVNLRAHADIVRALLPSLRAAGPGSAIVGIAS